MHSFRYPLKVYMHIKNTKQFKRHIGLVGLVLFLMTWSLQSGAQNMPYSKRGIGDPVHNRNILNTGMGGVSEAYSDAQTLNFANPASYADLRLTTLDVGFNAGSYNLHNQDTGRFESGFGSLSYLQVGVPLKKGGGWGLVFGLKPLTKINYRISTTDSVSSIGERALNLYEGGGGAYKAFVGTAYGYKGFRVGVNVGYLFGTKKKSVQTLYPDDSLGLFNSHTRERTGYGAFFVDFGVQADINLADGILLKLGASGGMKTELKGKRDYLLETFYYSGSSSDRAPKNQDTAVFIEGQKGTVVYPAHYGGGFLLQNTRGKGSWSIGMDYETTKWSDYEYYGKNGGLDDNQTIRVGAQFIPSDRNPGNTTFFERIAYRVGYYHTNKNFKSNNTGVQEHGFTLGFGLPARNHVVQSNQFSLVNLAFEFGKRGTKDNMLNANFFRVSLGLSLSDIWFIEHKYR